jgi:hypothetical protein
MAVEKEKVIARFRAGKFRNVPITHQTLDAIATKLSSKIPDDANDDAIDLELDDLNDLLPGGFMEVHKNDQRKANEKKKQEQPSTESQQKEPQDQSDLSKLIANAINEAVAPLMQKVQSLETEKVQSTIQQQVKAKLNDVPEDYWGIAPLPNNPEDVDSFVDTMKVKYTAFEQNRLNKSLGDGKTPRGNQSTSGKKASPEEIAAIMKNFK